MYKNVNKQGTINDWKITSVTARLAEPIAPKPTSKDITTKRIVKVAKFFIFFSIALVLNGLGLTPTQMVEGFAFLFAVDRIVDMFRTMLNITSDAVVAAVIADNENELNYDMLTNEESYKDII